MTMAKITTKKRAKKNIILNVFIVTLALARSLRFFRDE